DHCIDGQPIDEQFAERGGEAGAPCVAIDRHWCASCERAEMAIDQCFDMARTGVRRQHEAQEFREVAYRRANRRELPVEGVARRTAAAPPQAYIARIEIMVNERLRQSFERR